MFIISIIFAGWCAATNSTLVRFIQFHLLHPQYLFAFESDVIRHCLLPASYMLFDVLLADSAIVRFIQFSSTASSVRVCIRIWSYTHISLLSPSYLPIEMLLAHSALVRFTQFHLLHHQYVFVFVSEAIHTTDHYLHHICWWIAASWFYTCKIYSVSYSASSNLVCCCIWVILEWLLSLWYLQFEMLLVDFTLVRFIQIHLLHPQGLFAIASEVIRHCLLPSSYMLFDVLQSDSTLVPFINLLHHQSLLVLHLTSTRMIIISMIFVVWNAVSWFYTCKIYTDSSSPSSAPVCSCNWN